MTRSPRRSTLFPYTTVCRSQRVRDQKVSVLAQRLLADPDAAGGEGELADGRVAPAVLLLRGCQAAANGALDFVAPQEDRKSTRLNSSHANISYAVFCLKQKI